MARRRKQKNDSDPLLEVLPLLAGLLVLAILFVPEIRHLLGALFILLAVGLVLAAMVLIGRAIWRYHQAKMRQEAMFGFLPAENSPASDSQPPTLDLRLQTRDWDPPEPAWTRELLSELEWKRFEEVVAAYSRELGYEAKTTRMGADGGVDVLLYENGQEHPLMVIQCKAWDVYKVGVKPVRELYGVMAAERWPTEDFLRPATLPRKPKSGPTTRISIWSTAPNFSTGSTS